MSYLPPAHGSREVFSAAPAHARSRLSVAACHQARCRAHARAKPPTRLATAAAAATGAPLAPGISGPDAASAKHVIVVGAGIGGLVTAGRLAKAGCRVTVLEQSEQVTALNQLL